MRRLQVLIESNLDVCAYNLTSFIVKHLVEHVFDVEFSPKRLSKYVFLSKEWLKDDPKNNAYNILELHLALLYKRKEDTSKLQYLVSAV